MSGLGLRLLRIRACRPHSGPVDVMPRGTRGRPRRSL